MQTKSGKSFPILAVLMLSACGGGGGESATPLSSWTPSSTVIANGLGQEISYGYDPVNKRVTSISEPSAVSGNYSTQLTLDAGVLTGLTLTTPTTTISFASYEIRDLTPAIWGATNRTSNALLANPMNLGWDYQSFGVWETGLDTTSGTFGAFSVGAPTTDLAAIAATVPTATFGGLVGGSYVKDGVGHAVLADLTVTANFANQSLLFGTNNTRTSLDWTNFALNPDLDLTGTLTIKAGTNSFDGTLSTVSGLTGSSTGQFYGPTGEELGGVFFLQGNGETYTGAYGAKDITAP
jgi:hypothetical protein